MDNSLTGSSADPRADTMTALPACCLILACGNPLREDDGVGPWLAQWAAERFSTEPRVHVLSCRQWTPELADDLAGASSVVFIDCSVASPAGKVTLLPVAPAADARTPTNHHLDAALLLALTQQIYNALPHTSWLLTVGAGSVEFREGLSDAVRPALPEACRLLESAVLQQLNSP